MKPTTVHPSRSLGDVAAVVTLYIKPTLHILQPKKNKMAINRELWTPPFASFPSWLCPSCQTGTLALNNETFNNLETGPSEKSHDHEAWEPEWIIERFVGLLVCQNEVCGELVAMGGCSHIDVFEDYEHQERTLERAFQPIFMYPAPPVFPIPKKCPKVVANELKKSFALFWSDAGSCANRLRAAAEALLTDRKIPHTTLNKNGKRERISLHARIEKLKQKDTRSADYLLAVKWLGNTGSHADVDRLNRNDLLDGFELFEHVVEIVYVKREKHLRKLAREISFRKGRPIRHKSLLPWE